MGDFLELQFNFFKNIADRRKMEGYLFQDLQF